MKKNILDQFLDKTLSRKDAAKLLNMAPTAFSRLKRGYVEQGVNFLVPKKPGPKANSPPTNKTPKVIEDLVVNLAYDNRFLGPAPLAEKLFDDYGIVIDSVTVWRILKRRHVRYGQEYIKIPKAKPQLYSLDEPGIEVQMDGCYPFGRSRKIICFDAVDDCSRHAFSKIYHGTENTDIAIRFVNELVAKSPYIIQTIKIDNKLGKRFTKHCESLGIMVVRIDPYQPQQNGKVERYHRTLNEMLFWSVLSIHDDVETLNYKLTLWLAYYNRQRRHGGYGMNRMTPNAKIASILAKNLTNNYFGCSYPQNVTGTLQQYTH
jgi:transposase InsO family protein